MIIEPSAEHREVATAQYQMYLAYIQAGFTEQQALRLMCAMIRRNS